MEIIINNKKKSNIKIQQIAFARNSLLKLIREKYNTY